MQLKADFIAKRATLRWLAERQPHWTHQELATALQMSRSWVSKWRKLLRQADPYDVMALHSRSHARHTPPASIARPPAVVQRILEIRTTPPESREPRPRSRSHSVLFATRPRAQTRRPAPASVADTDLEDSVPGWLYCPGPPILATEAIRSHIRKETVSEEPFLSPTRRRDGKKMEMIGHQWRYF